MNLNSKRRLRGATSRYGTRRHVQRPGSKDFSPQIRKPPLPIHPGL